MLGAAVLTLALTTVDVAIPLLGRIYLDWIIGSVRFPLPFVMATHPEPLLALLFGCGIAHGLLIAGLCRLTSQSANGSPRACAQRSGAISSSSRSSAPSAPAPERPPIRFVTDIRAVKQVISDGLVQGTQDLLTVLVVLTVLVWLSWRMALPVVLLIPTLVGIFRVLNPRIRQVSRATRKQRVRLSAYLNERIVGIKVVKANVRQDQEINRVRRLTRQLAARGMRMANAAGLLQGAVATAISCSTVLVLAITAGEIAAGRVSSGTLVAFFLLVGLLAPIFRRLARLNRSLQEAAHLARPGGRAAGRTPGAVPRRPVAVVAGPRWPAAAVKRVSFAHRGGPLVLDGDSLQARRGELVALVGPTGAGKSTLLELILRFHSPSTCRVVIDGRDLARARVDSLRAQIGWVSQDPLLFDGSIADNIAYGAARACSRQEIERAADLAAVSSFAADLRGGLDAPVGPQGQRLAPGQRQQVALARALVAAPPILLLDELSATLDYSTERTMARALRELTAQCTILVVSRRLPILQLADRVYFLSAGRIVRHGRHSQLVHQNRAYARVLALPRPVQRGHLNPRPGPQRPAPACPFRQLRDPSSYCVPIESWPGSGRKGIACSQLSASQRGLTQSGPALIGAAQRRDCVIIGSPSGEKAGCTPAGRSASKPLSTYPSIP